MKNAIYAVILAAVSAVTSVQAAWDAKYLPEPTHSNYLSDHYLAEGAWRTVKQLHSFDQPDENGFLYVEHVTEYDCARNTYKVVQSLGFRSWDDTGQSLKTYADTWKPVLNSADQTIIGRLCARSRMADAVKYMN